MTAGEKFPAIRFLLAKQKAVVNGGAAAVALVAAWFAWRLALPELYLVAAALGVAMHFVLRVAIEVVGLVAETLMPQ